MRDHDRLGSFKRGLDGLCEKNGWHIGKPTTLQTVSRVVQLDPLAINDDDQLINYLKNLYSGAMLEWEILCFPESCKELSFLAYFKPGCSGKEIAIVEMTSQFYDYYHVSPQQAQDSFWTTIEKDSKLPVFGVVWKSGRRPIVCHCGD
ncbi:MAG: hypothetical protein WAW33_01760 [Minisyncoccia bacterium]|jgi:hypothetical protein